MDANVGDLIMITYVIEEDAGYELGDIMEVAEVWENCEGVTLINGIDLIKSEYEVVTETYSEYYATPKIKETPIIERS